MLETLPVSVPRRSTVNFAGQVKHHMQCIRAATGTAQGHGANQDGRSPVEADRPRRVGGGGECEDVAASTLELGLTVRTGR